MSSAERKRKPSSRKQNRYTKTKLGHGSVSTNQAKLGHGSVLQKRIGAIRPSPENDKLYKPIDHREKKFLALVASIKQFGIQSPIIVDLDGWIISGHRRYAAAQAAGLSTVPCIVQAIRRVDDINAFIRLLKENNEQREKTFDEKLREQIVSTDPLKAHRAMLKHREKKAAILSPTLELVGTKKRCQITAAKIPLLNGAIAVINDRQKFWPISDRQIHYALLNNPPLIHASKPNSTYTNNSKSYKALVELLTRARIDGTIPMHCIGDDTRPVVTWEVHNDVSTFMQKELDGLFKGYFRNLLHSQPNHFEIIGEKNTVASILKPIAAKYRIPLTTGRGYCSLPPRHEMVDRFNASGKEKLILLMLTDFDPDGEEIAHSFARGIRDDFGIANIHPIKVALTADQVRQYNLPPILKAKEDSKHFEKFTDKYGDDVFELEAIPPATLQQLLQQAIDSLLDVDAFNYELDQEKQDAAHLQAARRTIQEHVANIDFSDDDQDEGEDADE